MKKEITRQNKECAQRILDALEGVDNIVPFRMKTVFNFKGRKSPAVAQRVIEAITSENDVLLDPFMGSGAFVIAAAKAGRRIAATDIDNYTYSAVCTMLCQVDFDKLGKLFHEVEADAKNRVMQLYKTMCCGQQNYIEKLYFDPAEQEFYRPRPNREFADGRNVKLVAPCPICGGKDKPFDRLDEEMVSAICDEDVKAFPKACYIENSRINITASTGANRYDRIFTKRNQKALLIIQEAISGLSPCAERDVLEHALVSALSLARISMYGSSTDILYHVVPYGAQEMNVWLLFESKYNSFLNFKKENREILHSNDKENLYTLFNQSYQDFCAPKVLSEAYDLIYTDFPYTDQVPYLERNQLYRIWLQHFYDSQKFALTKKMLDEELVQSDSCQRPNKKGVEQYYADIDKMFAAFYKVLKTESMAVLTVKLGKNKYFTTLIEIINLARKNGFEYAFRIGIDKNDPTIRKQSAYKNTLSNEMIIAFQKLRPEQRYWYVGNKNYEFETVRLVYKAIEKEELDLSGAVKLVKTNLLKKDQYIAADDDIEIISSIVKNNFTVDDNTAIVRKDPNKLYLDIEDNSDLFMKFYNYVPVMIRRLLEGQGQFVLDDLYFEIANALCNGDPKTINQFLEDPRHASGIDRLICNYCETDGRVYTKKNYAQATDDDAVDISTLEGGEFEQLMKKLLEAEGYFDVIALGGAGDLGVDLVAKKWEDRTIRNSLFQCKRWASNVGSEPMQRLDSERHRRNADYAICITTSDYTEDGKKISRERDIEAWNGEDVIHKLNLHDPGKYYNGIL